MKKHLINLTLLASTACCVLLCFLPYMILGSSSIISTYSLSSNYSQQLIAASLAVGSILLFDLISDFIIIHRKFSLRFLCHGLILSSLLIPNIFFAATGPYLENLVPFIIASRYTIMIFGIIFFMPGNNPKFSVISASIIFLFLFTSIVLFCFESCTETHFPIFPTMRYIIQAIAFLCIFKINFHWISSFICQENLINVFNENYFQSIQVISLISILLFFWITDAIFGCESWMERKQKFIIAHLYFLLIWTIIFIYFDGRANRYEFQETKVR